MTFRIITVCTGNICRSPMAEYMLRGAFEDEGLGERVEISSGGTTSWESGEPIDARAGAKLRELGFDPSSHRAHQVTAQELAQADLVLALDHDHVGPIERVGGKNLADRLHMLREFDPDAPEDLGIRDPWYGDSTDFEDTADKIEAASRGIVEHVRSRLA
ncbi:protein tyrosine phosphatase [Brachybacterium endophyticum]|uniref:protein-tyrosine-phosphatase n=1 Tax=Brachybacterium endophyticum TaxID=2182385 RepID=A0A2U2RM92_9MICO|nr:low molecular weight protein-tyrosine-phosphatase [Brachybacterium endophyticum]PWH06904.1 protein tyrosine phosphatase [Brachybacterium endophyticum]